MLENHENENLRRFLFELEEIKKSNPKQVITIEAKKEFGEIFSKFFGNHKKEENNDIIYEDIYLDGYISIAEFIKKIQYLFNYISNSASIILEKYKKYVKNNEIFFPYISIDSCRNNYFYIGYFKFYSDMYYKSKNYSEAKEKLKIDIRQFPTLVKGEYNCYEYLKKDFFKLFPYLKLYIEILLEIKKKNRFHIERKNHSDITYILKDGNSNDTSLNIYIDNENDVFRKEFPVFKLEISNLAMVEYVLNEKMNCLSYSDDFEILNYMQNEERKLLYSCYLSNELYIVKLLNSINFES